MPCGLQMQSYGGKTKEYTYIKLIRCSNFNNLLLVLVLKSFCFPIAVKFASYSSNLCACF